MRLARELGLFVLVAGGVMALPRPAAAFIRTYICYFDSGDTLPTALCQQRMQEFVDWWLSMGGASTCENRTPTALIPGSAPRRIELQGHGDRAEQSRRIADRVARQRAEVVAGLMRANCIPADRIVVLSHGATRLLLPTPPGVEEPQNRRVEMIIR